MSSGLEESVIESSSIEKIAERVVPKVSVLGIGGGYPRGSIVLLEVDENVPRGGVSSILNPVRLNFINNGNGVFSIPSAA